MHFLFLRRRKINKSNDISTMYTKELNMKTGRKEWLGWKNEKETSIEPASYGGYLLQQRKHARYDILRGKTNDYT